MSAQSNKKGSTPTITEQRTKAFKKEQKRLTRSIKRLEKRGYFFPNLKFLEAPKRITIKSVERLQKLATKALYEFARYVTPEGDLLKGTERRKEERKISAQKAQETKRRKKYEELISKERELLSDQTTYETETQLTPEDYSSQQEFEEKIRKRDEAIKRKLQQDEQYKKLFSEGKIVYDEISYRIHFLETQHKKSAESLMNTLRTEIDKYGYEPVMRSIAQAPQEFKEEADVALRYSPTDDRHVQAIQALTNIIRGTVMSMQEAQEMQDRIDEDSYEDEIY